MRAPAAAEMPDWHDEIFAALKAAEIGQIGYVPDAGHARLIENVQDLKHRVTSLEEQVAGLRSETAEHSWGHGGDVSQARSHRTAARPSKWQTQAITFGLFSVMHAHTDSPIALAWSHRGFCGSPGNMSVFRPASCLAASPLQWPLGRRSLSGSRTR